MKKCLTLLIATVLSGISLTAYAAQPMSNLDSGQLRPAGTVSATGAGGNDQMFGTAIIYK